MSASLNSPSDSTTSRKKLEELADLTQNHDEVLDLEMALGALGGLRHTAACDAADRSNRRFDDRNHRLHEARMKALGLEGDEKEPETEDMSQQVLIRSPVIHNHHYQDGAKHPPTAVTPQPPIPQVQPYPQSPNPAPSSMSNWAKAGLLAGVLGMPLATGAIGYLLANRDPFVDTDTDTRTGLGLPPPGPPLHKVGSP